MIEINPNQYYLVRGLASGLFFGQIKAIETLPSGIAVNFVESRRIYSWDGACTPHQMAKDGIVAPEHTFAGKVKIDEPVDSDPKPNKITVWTSDNWIFDAIEILPCTDQATKCLKDAKQWKR